MSLLIKGMEMPKEGSWIELRIFPDGQCFLYSWCGNDFDFMEHLTAAPVPPHGRLIDADALTDNWDYASAALRPDDVRKVVCLDDIDNAPTIIEAEET